MAHQQRRANKFVMPSWSSSCDGDYEYRAKSSSKSSQAEGKRKAKLQNVCYESKYDEYHKTGSNAGCCRPSRNVLSNALGISNLEDGRWLLRNRFQDVTKSPRPKASQMRSRTDISHFAVRLFKEAEKQDKLDDVARKLEAHRQDRLARIKRGRARMTAHPSTHSRESASRLSSSSSRQKQEQKQTQQQKPIKPKREKRLEPPPTTKMREDFVDICRAHVSKAAREYWSTDPCFDRPKTLECVANYWVVQRFLPTIIEMYHLGPAVVFSPKFIKLTQEEQEDEQGPWNMSTSRSLERDLRRKGVRIVTTRLLIVRGGDHGWHMNAIVIDLPQRRVLRFEPHGKLWKEDTSRALDEVLINELIPIIEKATGLKGFELIPPNVICPREEGPQVVDRNNKTETQKIRCPLGGMCSVWAQMFLFLLIMNPNASESEIVDEMLRPEPNLTLNVKVRKFYTFMQDTYDNAPAKIKAAVQRILDERITR